MSDEYGLIGKMATCQPEDGLSLWDLEIGIVVGATPGGILTQARGVRVMFWTWADISRWSFYDEEVWYQQLEKADELHRKRQARWSETS